MKLRYPHRKYLNKPGRGIKVEKFTKGDIRKPVLVQGSFTKQQRNPHGNDE
jgi:hypothetical protein